MKMDSKYSFVLSSHKSIKHSLSHVIQKRPSEYMTSPKKRPCVSDLAASIASQRRSLPIYNVRKRIIEEIVKHSTVIIIGETGCGKTTQVPQYILENGINKNGMIAITQPRRVAAISICHRVAQEMNSKQGDLVGYTVRFEDITSEITKLKYMTDGMLLREAMIDKLLMKYSVIILDEAHERTVHTDVLFGIIKHAQAIRKTKEKTLKVIIMSATMDVDHFSNYFNKAPIVYLEGRQFPVTIYHTLQTQEDYAFSCLVTVFQIHKEAPANHDILVFLTGQEEIEAMAHSIRSLAKELEGKGPLIKVYPLYSSLPSHQQLEVFRPTSVGMRKVILSTNIAETSVTISGIKYVIDSGMVKARSHHPGTGLDMLKVQRISQAQAWQRAGRAGRESTGSCYRVYTKKEFDLMLKMPVPEIQRCNLTSVILQLLSLGVNCLTYDFIDKPSRESVISALQQLKLLGAIESVEKPILTKLGRQMSSFPLDPRFSKILLSAKDYNCVEEILSIVALLSSESVYWTPPSKRDEALESRQKFISSSGDHFTLLNIFKAYSKVDLKKQWCHENFLNARNLEYASEVRSQLRKLCLYNKLPLVSCGTDCDKIKKCLITGLFMNIAELQMDRQYITIELRQLVSIHPSSVLFGSLPPYVLFTEIVHTGRCYIRQVTSIDNEWITEIVPNYKWQHRIMASKSS